MELRVRSYQIGLCQYQGCYGATRGSSIGQTLFTTTSYASRGQQPTLRNQTQKTTRSLLFVPETWLLAFDFGGHQRTRVTPCDDENSAAVTDVVRRRRGGRDVHFETLVSSGGLVPAYPMSVLDTSTRPHPTPVSDTCSTKCSTSPRAREVAPYALPVPEFA
eukprot:458488-Rhodomonas_salina.2